MGCNYLAFQKLKKKEMKQFRKTLGLFLCLLTITSSTLVAQITLPEASQRGTVSQRVGITDITIDYGRPSVKGRKIWGELVPYGFNNFRFGTSTAAPWRSGANYNTTIDFTHDVKIEGKDIKAGTYGLHMALQEDGKVTLIFSTNTTSWGSYFYKESEDVLRVDVLSKEGPQTEILTYTFDNFDATSATASLKWDKKVIPFKIEVNVTDIVMKGIADDLRNPKGFQQSSWDNAASYAYNAGKLEKALEWVNASISGNFFSKETFSNLSLKSQILRKQGKTSEANELITKASRLGNSSELYQLGTQLIAAGEKDIAFTVLKNNVKDNKGAWPSNYGLAKGYAAKGDYKNAIKSINKSLNVAPDRFKNRLNSELEKLKKGENIN